MPATVKSVDLKTRMVTLVGAKGETTTLKLGPDVQDLPQIEVGDTITVVISEAVVAAIEPSK